MSTIIEAPLTTEPRPSGHYSKAVMHIAGSLIPQMIQAMPSKFESNQFIKLFAERHALAYEIIVKFYLADQPLNMSPIDRRRHATQVAHQQIMHTVCNRFHHLVAKKGDVPNPNGGDQSTWEKMPQAH
jgi:hypothetical protein